jgi:hypothetical protein
MNNPIVSHPRPSFVFCLLSLLTLPASAETQEAKSARRTEETIAALKQRTDPDSLAAAGLLSLDKHRGQSLPLIARAIDASPRRADLVWLQIEACQKVSLCDPEPMEQHLRELDPANGAGWWGALARAGAAHDTEATDAVLAAISHSDRLDIYWTTLVAHLGTALANTKKMSLAESEVMIIGYIAAQAIPAYLYISSSCKGERLQQAGVTEVCRGVASALQRGDTYITEMIGVAIAKRVWPEDSPEWKAAAEERRLYEYRSSFYLKMTQREITHPGEYLTLCARNRREQDVLLAQLIKAGINPTPPPQ